MCVGQIEYGSPIIYGSACEARRTTMNQSINGYLVRAKALGKRPP